MSDDQVGCEWASVSSGTGLPGLSRTKAVKRLRVCVCIGSVYHLTDLHEYHGKMIFCTGNVTHEL